MHVKITNVTIKISKDLLLFTALSVPLFAQLQHQTLENDLKSGKANHQLYSISRELHLLARVIYFTIFLI